MDNIKNDKYYLLKIINDIDKVISYSKGLSFEEFLENEIVKKDLPEIRNILITNIK
jgi:uncharacterized protein with HEPN domain